MDGFGSMTVPKLRKYLQERGVTVTGYLKAGLVELSNCVSGINLPVDPDFATCQATSETVKITLAEAGLSDPFKDTGFSSSMAGAPVLGLYDIFNYLVHSKADYDEQKLRAYKSFEDYRLFFDGHVLDVTFNLCGESGLCAFRAEVRPTQKENTYMKTKNYMLWIIMEKKERRIRCAFCQCQGGSDGACRHVAAALYALEAFHDQAKSVTDGPAQWTKKARASDHPQPISQLQIATAKYGMVPSDTLHPQVEYYRSPDEGEQTTEESIAAFAQGLRSIDPHAGVLELISEEAVLQEATREISPQAVDLCALNRVRGHLEQFIERNPNGGEFTVDTLFEDFKVSSQLTSATCQDIRVLSAGQASNPNWHCLRKGVITASNFKRVFTRQATLTRDPTADPSALLNSIMFPDQDLETQALKWGNKKEAAGLQEYKRLGRKQHYKLRVEQTGVCMSEACPLIGGSPDGIISCKCANHDHNMWLVEVKCPYALRTLHPSKAALSRGCFMEDGVLKLSPKHKFYFQVQGQMGLLSAPHCDLVIYTNRGIAPVNVPFDPAFYKNMMSSLESFAKTYLYPELITQS